MSASDNTAFSSTAQPNVQATPNIGDPITVGVFHDMIACLDALVSHTHVYYDDYGTACNCWVNNNCTRGIL